MKQGKNLSVKAIPRHGPDLVSRRSNGGFIIVKLDVEQGFFTITGIAADFWSQINGKKTIGAIRNKIISKHHPPLIRFDKDLKGLVKRLVKEQLIELI